ncbi:MAG TPA: penicillin-binding protein 2, partial [Steroidobacteraceae bacterium]|nr:penicillin-binding protein 2 [Steroidobacteraceae bacterium]
MIRSVRLKDQVSEQRLLTRRAVIAGLLILLLVGALIARLYYLQVVRYDHFSELSQGNRIRIEPLPPNRGLIFDRHGVALALNRPAYQLELVREQVPDVEETLARLVDLDLLAEDEVDRVRRTIRARRSFEAVPVRLQLSEEELSTFAVRRQDFPGVEIRPRLTRYYPLGESAVHALGYVGAISEADQERISRADYAGTTLIGKLGVEGAYENELHGSVGFQQLLVNAQGRRVGGQSLEIPDLARREPVAGDDLYLAIDSDLQLAAEQALAGQRGALVAIDPANGDVLALASVPNFDPNRFGRGLSVSEYNALVNDIDRPMFNRALRGTYPPGSTIKPVMALAGLEFGVVTPAEGKFCRGFYTLPGSRHRYRDWRPQGHGTIDLRQSVAQSCDVYYYDLANDIGIDRMHEFLTRFGLGSPVGIDIAGERGGIVPSKEWKRTAFRRREEQVWFPGETVIAGIGQGYMLTTPLQLAHVAATVAARGQRFEPRLVRAIRDPLTDTVREIPPRELPPVVLADPGAWQHAVDGMVAVMSDPRGTARRSQQDAPYQIAGKTGTAQVFSVG